ncbi:MAG TPA: group II intron reverse transcriptase/maturase [Dictyobacter sp.]|jgi:RNA-directed DNA polymerase|nr:group II intron reverse transcriptase/maturase [Dictyobacter sp.]
MAKRKAPKTKPPLDPESEAWNNIPWHKLEQHCFRIQKRIFRASQRGKTRAVHKLQKLLMKSQSARILAVRRVTQDNQGKKTAGIDGIKSVKPAERLAMANQIHPKHWKATSPPARRVWIPKPGKTEKRPLGIPVMIERARQHLAKLALEPEWESRFEPNSYGFRPGRSCHDAMEAIFNAIKQKEKYVLDADLKGAFDNINHQKLLDKLKTYPTMKRIIRAWLKAGAIDQGAFEETSSGAPQGGTVSPLLANIALYGMEEVLLKASIGESKAPSALRGAPQLIRYADDFVVLHEKAEEVKKAQQIIAKWLQGIGLELKPSKTRLSHTLNEYQGNVGFDFLGFTVRQFPVGRTHTGKDPKGRTLGFKTIITPSKEGVQRHLQELRRILQKGQSLPQEELIDQLNPVIHGWALYYRTVVSAKEFARCDHLLESMLWQKMTKKHPKKGAGWVKRKYWRTIEGNAWTFATPEGPEQQVLRWHVTTPIQRHIKVKGNASPFDGNLLYWAKRLKDHPLTKTTRGKLLQKQQGKCRWCELLFKDGDQIEIDHITPKSEGGGEELSNKCALHRHCHDQRHAKHATERINDN